MVFPPKKSVTVIIMLYKNTEVIVCLLNSQTDFFDIFMGVLPGDIH